MIGAVGFAPLCFSVVRAAPPPRIRIGQIGTAHAHASGKTDAMRKSTEFEFVGVVEPDPVHRARAEQNRTYAGVSWLTEEQLLNTPGLRAVTVETAGEKTFAFTPAHDLAVQETVLLASGLSFG
jgi:hypothetical protein